jgi:hypothetical protein
MKFNDTQEIYSLVKAFENRTMLKSEWTHEAHLVVGLYYCRTRAFAVAKNVMRDGIYWLNDTHGTPNTDDSGYHETLTIFWLKRIWNFLDERSDVLPLAALANELIDLYDDPRLPLSYYSRELLFSTSARHEYFPPDLRQNRHLSLSITLCSLKPLL